MIDEILSFHRYSLAFGGEMVLPEIVEGEQHSPQRERSAKSAPRQN